MFVFVYDIFSVSNLILIVILHFQTAKSVLFRGLMVLNTLVTLQSFNHDASTVRGMVSKLDCRRVLLITRLASGFCSVLFTLVVDTGISLQHRI